MPPWRSAEFAGRSLLLSLSLLASAPVQAQQDVAVLFAEGRLGAAYAETQQLTEPGLRAEWRFHLLYTAGDYPGALAAAREGLAQVPEHPGLLANAARCATLLGLGEEALAWAERLRDLPGAADERAEQRAQRLEQAAALVSEARGLADLEAAGEAGRLRALRVALAGLLLSAGLLLVLARTP